MIEYQTEAGFMGWVIKYHTEYYQVDNPEWHRLNDLLTAARAKAPDLKEALDSAISSGPRGWVGGKSDETFAELRDLRNKARTAAQNAVDGIRQVRDLQPAKLTKSKKVGVRIWEDD